MPRGRRSLPERVLRLSPAARYGIAVAAVGLAVLLRLAGDPLWGVKLPFITLYPAMMLSAWLGGLGPGIVTTVLGLAVADYLWLSPVSSFAISETSDLVALVLVLGMGILISMLSEAWRRATAELGESGERERQAKRDAEQANRLKDEFLAVLSHELRTPLNATLGWANLLNSGILPPEKARHAAEVIERSARAEAQLVDSLLDLSRIMEGKLRLEPAPLDLAAAVRAAADMLRPAADAKGVALEVAAPALPVAVIADAGRLQQVFWNLLSNAVKFTPRGGRVGISLTLREAQARVQISDSGQGIRADFLPYIFDRFAQADSALKRPRAGLGLGLAIVRELVQAHGGTVDAESPGEGQGSIFTVTLPLPAVAKIVGEHQATSEPAARAGGGRSEAPTDSLAALRVLVVDDHSDARELLSLTLQSYGALVEMAASAAAALASIRWRRPSVLLADIQMPDEDGYRLIHKVRELEREEQRKRLPAIAVTAYASASDHQRALAAGFDGHLAKPVEPTELVRAVAQLANARAE
jgi:signal transduction histidine kinase/ActR/RegA family two-component response regulator